MNAAEWIGVAVVIIGCEIIRHLGKIHSAINASNEHLRIIRQHELSAIQRGIDAAIEATHDPLWKRHGD